MRIAIVADVHGNRSAFDAVRADLRYAAPDLILHGGDLADSGSAPAEIVDEIRGLGWPGVCGNTDEMLFDPASLEAFASSVPALAAMFQRIAEMADAAREKLGDARLEWLRGLPRRQIHGRVALVHASPGDLWRAPAPEAADDELAARYGPLARPVVAYGHVHRPFVRKGPALTVANTGSAGLPYDGDPRASYLLIDDADVHVRRVVYDIERERRALAQSGLPHAAWVAAMLGSGRFVMPG